MTLTCQTSFEPISCSLMETLISPPLSLQKRNTMVLVDLQKQSLSITSAQNFKDENKKLKSNTADFRPNFLHLSGGENKPRGDHFFCSRQSTFSFSRCLLTYSCLGRVTDGSEDGGTSYFLFYWLSISSIPSCRAATKSYTLRASSLSHTPCDVCICVWLWLIFIFCGCFRRPISLCCRVQFAIRQPVWNGALRSKMWCVWFLKGDEICNLHGDTAVEIWTIHLPLSSSSISTIYI